MQRHYNYVSLNNNQPAKLTLTSSNGRVKTFDVILEKHIATTVLNFHQNSTFTQSANSISFNALDKTQFYGTARYGGAAVAALCIDYTKGQIENYQDTTQDNYFNVSYACAVGGKSETDGALKVMKKGDCNGSWPGIHINELGLSYGRLDKYDYSFDFLYSEIESTGSSLISPTIMQEGGQGAARLNLTPRDENSINIQYAVNGNYTEDSSYYWYGKQIGIIEKNTWHNIRMIIDRNNTQGKKFTIVLDGNVILNTDYGFTLGAENNNFSAGSNFRFLTSGTSNGVFYIDNLHTTYSQALPND